MTAMSAPFLTLLLPPLLAAAGALALPPRRRGSWTLHAALALVSLLAALRLASLVLDGFTVTYGEGSVDASGRRRGSGLYAATTGDVTVTGCVFQENYAIDGGAIWHGGPGLLTLTDTVVRFGHAQAVDPVLDDGLGG